MPWTAEELAEMAKADAEIEASFVLDNEDLLLSQELDCEAKLERMSPKQRKIAKYKRRYYAANKAKEAERHRRYYAANKERIAEYKRRYYAANKERIAEYKRRYRATNKAKIAERYRRYYAANKAKEDERHRRYRASSKEKWANAKQALKEARASAGLSQAKAARILGVSKSRVGYWETISPPENWADIVSMILSRAEEKT